MSRRISRNVISDGRSIVRTSTLLIRGELCRRRILLCPNMGPRKALVLDLGFEPNIEVDNELLGPIPLQ